MSSMSESDTRGRTPRPSAAVASAALVALVALVALASACGGGGSGGNDREPTTPTGPGGPKPTATPVASATVAMSSRASDGYSAEEHRFTPEQVTLRLGGTVTWTNETGLTHNVTFGAADGAPQNVANNASGSSQRTFAKAGTYTYTCTNHSGMSGSVVVVE